jgi:hypothetical protein
MEIDDLRREAIRCRNLGNKDTKSATGAWYRDRGIRLAQEADDLAAEAGQADAAESP